MNGKMWFNLIMVTLCIILMVYGIIQHRCKNQLKYIHTKENIILTDPQGLRENVMPGNEGGHDVTKTYIGYQGAPSKTSGNTNVFIGEEPHYTAKNFIGKIYIKHMNNDSILYIYPNNIPNNISKKIRYIYVIMDNDTIKIEL